MSKLVPLLREGADGLERMLLESAREDAPPNDAARIQTLAAIKAATGAATGTGAAALGAKGAKVAGAFGAKWFVIAAVGMSAAVATQVLVRAPVSSRPAVAVTAAPPIGANPLPSAIGAPPLPRQSPVPSPSTTAVAATVATGSPTATPNARSTPTRQVDPRTTHDETSAAAPSIGTDANAAAEVTPTDSTSAGGPATGAPAPMTREGLREETALLESVRQALASSDARRALTALDRYDARFATGVLQEEAMMLRVEALWAAGRREEARVSGVRFVQTHPSSSYAPRIRALLEKKE